VAEEGCFTNTERRVNLIRNVCRPHGDSKPDLWIFNEVAKRFERGRKIRFPETAEGVFEEMKQLSKGRFLDISGMSYTKIEQSRGLQWPCVDGADQGAARLYVDGVFQYPGGKAKLIPLPFIDNNERRMPNTRSDQLRPVVEHFHTRTRTGKVGNANKFSPTPYMEMNPDAAARLGIRHGSYARPPAARRCRGRGAAHPARGAGCGVHPRSISRVSTVSLGLLIRTAPTAYSSARYASNWPRPDTAAQQNAGAGVLICVRHQM
jgi:predicted molibdopterin-dependent oxidoreductase YjgC